MTGGGDCLIQDVAGSKYLRISNISLSSKQRVLKKTGLPRDQTCVKPRRVFGV